MMTVSKMLALFAAAASLFAACDLGTYELVIGVINNYNEPIEVIIGDNAAQPGSRVGQAFPSVIEAHDALNVRLVVPATRDWALFVNAPLSLRPGPLFTAADTQGCRGRVPIEITVGPNGGQISVPRDLC